MRRSLKWLDVTENVLCNDLVLVFKCVNGLAADYLGKYFIKCSAVHNKNTRGCNNFVVPRCRLSMGQRAFYFRVQRNGMGYLTILRTLKILIVLSGDFLIGYFIPNNFEYISNNFECILNLIKLL